MRQFSPPTCNAMLMTTKHCKLLVGMLQLASQSCEDSSVFSVTCFAIFSLRCKLQRWGVTQSHNFFCNLLCNGIALQVEGKIALFKRTFTELANSGNFCHELNQDF